MPISLADLPQWIVTVGASAATGAGAFVLALVNRVIVHLGLMAGLELDRPFRSNQVDQATDMRCGGNS